MWDRISISVSSWMWYVRQQKLNAVKSFTVYKMKSCDKGHSAWFSVTWLSFQKQRPSEDVWTAEFLVYHAVWYSTFCHMLTCVWRDIKNSCTDTKGLQWSVCSAYHSLVLEMDAFYFLWKEWSYHSCHALGSVSKCTAIDSLYSYRNIKGNVNCFKFCDKWVPVTMTWHIFRLGGGGNSLQIWWVAANVYKWAVVDSQQVVVLWV